MQISVSLDPRAAAAAELCAELDAGLHALARPGIQVRGGSTPAGAEAFGLAEAYQFVVDCGPGILATLPLVTAVLQLSTAMLERRELAARKAKARRKAKRARPGAEAGVAPVMTVNVDGQRLDLPADGRRIAEFLNAVSR